MISEHQPAMAAEPNVVPEKIVGGSLPKKRNHGKVPKKIHKAEREKLKRDHLNELFLELGHALEPSQQNNGKACILGDATRLLRDLISEVEYLQKENAALVSESHYVIVETDELKDENVVLAAEIEKLQNKLQKRWQSDPVWPNNLHPASALPQATATGLPMQQPPVVQPLLVFPLHQEVQHYQEAESAPIPTSHVSRPQARYPTPSDSWPHELLSRHLKQSANISSTTNSGDSGSNKA